MEEIPVANSNKNFSVAPDTDFAGYPASRISGQSKKPDT
jgi:hypothetical protein